MDILQKKRFEKFGGVPFTTDVIAGELGGYSAILAKIASLVDEGSLIRIKRGLYCLSPLVSGTEPNVFAAANVITAPSYISFETALSFYGLIPERVDETMSACAARGRRFKTPIGTFSYRAVPRDWFRIGVRSLTREEGAAFLIATPEKALGDLLLARSNLRISSPDSLRSFLEEDIRLDFDALGTPDCGILREMASCGHKPLLMKALERIFT